MENQKIEQKKLKLSEIVKKNREIGHFFFSRDTMKFFKENMKSWKSAYINGINYVIRKTDQKKWKVLENGSIFPVNQEM